MIDLGRILIETNLSLLPNFNEIPLDPWREVFNEEISRFLKDMSDRTPLDKIGQLEEAQKMFSSILNEKDDRLLELVARGGEMVILTKETTGDIPLVLFGSDFNQRIVVYLASRLKKRFLSHIAERNYSLNFAGEYSRIDREWQDEQVPEAEKFLESLRLKGYPSVFSAYRYSRIPEIYLERRQVLEKAAKGSGKPLKLTDYPLD